MCHWKRLCAFIGLIVLSACAWTPHELQVKPTAEPTASDIGQGTRVFFRFVDERDDVTIGHRGVATVGAKISSSDLPGILEAQLRQSLAKKQFQLTDSEPGGQGGGNV